MFSNTWLTPLAQVLAQLGSQHALVLHARDGLDEISIAAITDVCEYKNGGFESWTIDPKPLGCAHANLNGIIVENPSQSLALAESVFSGREGPARDMILLNAAAALYCSDRYDSIEHAMNAAATSIDHGHAGQRFFSLRDLTQRLGNIPHE